MLGYLRAAICCASDAIKSLASALSLGSRITNRANARSITVLASDLAMMPFFDQDIDQRGGERPAADCNSVRSCHDTLQPTTRLPVCRPCVPSLRPRPAAITLPP